MKFLSGLFTIGISATEIYQYDSTSASKQRENTRFQCLHIGGEIEHALDRTGCAQVFDTIETANLACSLFENCLLIGQNTEGHFELFSESNGKTNIDLQDYELSIPTMAKSQTDLIYGYSYIAIYSVRTNLFEIFFNLFTVTFAP